VIELLIFFVDVDKRHGTVLHQDVGEVENAFIGADVGFQNEFAKSSLHVFAVLNWHFLLLANN
jgi:hypothetical protein